MMRQALSIGNLLQMPAIALCVLIAVAPVAAQTVGGVATPDVAQVAASMDAARAALLELEFTEFGDGELVVEVAQAVAVALVGI